MSRFANAMLGDDGVVLESEAYLIATCEEYDIDYETCEVKPVSAVKEGVISKIVETIKTIFKKVIAILVKIWKFIVGFLKKAISKAVDFFKRLLGIKSDKPTEITTGIITKPGTVEKKKFTKPADIVNEFKKANQSFDKEIATLERENIGYTKRMEQTVTREVAKEDYIAGLLEKTVYNKGQVRDDYKKLYSDYKDEDYTDKVYDSNYQGANRAEHQAVNKIDFLDTKSMEAVLESENICAAYKVFRMNSCYRLRQYAKSITSDSKIPDYNRHKSSMENIVKLVDALNDGGYDDETIDRYLAMKYFPSINDCETTEEAESKIRKWLKLRINWNNGIINSLQTMIRENAKFLGLSTMMAEAVSNAAGRGNLNPLRKVLNANLDKIVNDRGNIVDGRPIKLGVICIANEMADDYKRTPERDKSERLAGAYLQMMDLEHSDMALTYMTKYDLTILNHGGSDPEDGWFWQLTPAPDGSYPGRMYGKYTNPNEYLRAVIKMGFKKINILSCNPGHHQLDEDVRDAKGVLIRMSMNSTLAAH